MHIPSFTLWRLRIPGNDIQDHPSLHSCICIWLHRMVPGGRLHQRRSPLPRPPTICTTCQATFVSSLVHHPPRSLFFACIRTRPHFPLFPGAAPFHASFLPRFPIHACPFPPLRRPSSVSSRRIAFTVADLVRRTLTVSGPHSYHDLHHLASFALFAVCILRSTPALLSHLIRMRICLLAEWVFGFSQGHISSLVFRSPCTPRT
ncbi:hypothetical protein PYCCODRAFT_1254437 [Trametes coccinea BRFM310]|uniref:Uncharacterized protein n=1 Tax=Trametes coccinea (strain BRFM310) TaxID=1353009 RepID=A0A1Y2I6C9_TRAC3|nr:hypothetical protein PYCCODRAFT_1254437 [Trametes coccinea BRFM310]